MDCQKCKKECLESELKNGICRECETKSRSNTIAIIVISVFISVVLCLVIIGFANSEVTLSDFKIESFNMDTEKTTYKYADDTVTYKGTGVVSCKNKDLDYLILIEQKNKTENKTEYNYIIVHNGVGEFMTYDSNYSGTIEKPDYDFEIIGYRSFKK